MSKEEIVAAHRREMHNFTDGTPLTRIRAAEALSRLLGYDRFSVTVQHTGLPPHAALPSANDDSVVVTRTLAGGGDDGTAQL